MIDQLERLQDALADRYFIERPLGEGGMAVVYLADDLKHHRKVALKVMRSEIAESVGSARFVREIEVAARLQHPNILAMIDSGEVDGVFFYVMPFVAGESLRDRIAKVGALPIPEAIRILIDVADALGHAHAHGVVHRDIKPENVLISGRHALVADFGVAKASSPAHAPTRQRLTMTGLTLGTPAYMAPEQAMASAKADHRVDIYSFGVMAFEMLAGRAPFAAGSLQEFLAAQVSKRPETVERYRPDVPPALAKIVMKCLEKDPADRWQTADEIVALLEPLGTQSVEIASAATMPLTAHRPRRLPWAAVVPGIFGVVGIVAAIMALTGRIKGASFTVVASDMAQVTSDAGVEFQPAISPDGKQVAYVAGSISAPYLVIRSAVTAGSGGLALADTAHSSAWRPSWTPDGEFVRFEACPRGGPIRMGGGVAFGFRGCRPEEIPRLGGVSRAVAMTAGVEWAASTDGSRVAWVKGDTIMTALASGAEVRPLPIRLGTGPSPLHSLSWSPDSRRIAFVSGNLSWLTSANVDMATVWVVDLDKGTPHRVTDSDHLNVSPAWLDQRHLLFVSDRDGTRGVYVVTVEDDGPRDAPAAIPGLTDPHSISYSIAAARLAFSKFTTRQNVWSYPLHASAPVSILNGTPVTQGTHSIEEHDLSPDGEWLVYASNPGGNLDLYRTRARGGDAVALTSTPTTESGPAWSPNGREIAFYTMDSGSTRQIWVMPAEGGAAVSLTKGPAMKHLPRWRPDGLAVSFAISAGQDIHAWLVARDSVGGPWREPVPLGSFRANAMDWAPDGRSFVSSAVAGEFVEVTAQGKASLRPWPAARTLRLDQGAPLRYSRDGRTVYGVGSHADGRRGIWAIPASGNAPPRLVIAFDDASVVPLLGTGNLMSVGPDRLYLSVAQYESDIWVAKLRF